jgi:hypothetical protein
MTERHVPCTTSMRFLGGVPTKDGAMTGMVTTAIDPIPLWLVDEPAVTREW